MLRFCLTLRTFPYMVNLPKACNPRSRTRLRFYLTLKIFPYKGNLPKACDPRSQTRLRFCLTLKDFSIHNDHLTKCIQNEA